MKLHKLLICNYKSFQFSTEINFTHGKVEERRNIFLIGGMNGAGKTSIMEALNISLYGAKKNVIYNSINRKEASRGNYTCTFELSYETDELDNIVVKRSWQPSLSKIDINANDLEENLSITRNGSFVLGSNQDVCQEFLEISFPKGITQFFFFDGEKIQEMASDNHADLKLKNSLEAILGFDLFRRLIDDLSTLRNEERRSSLNITDEDLRLKENQLSLVENKKKKYLTSLEELNFDIRQFETELEDRKKRFNQLFGFESEESEDRKSLEKRKNQISSRILEIEQQVKTISEDSLPLAFLGSYFSVLRKQIQHESQVKQVAAIKDFASDLSLYISKELFSSKMICCSKLLTDSELNLYKNQIHDLIVKFPLKQIEDKTESILKLSDIEAGAILSRLSDIEKSYSIPLLNLIKEEENISTELEELERKLRKLPDNSLDRDIFYQIQSEIDGYNTQIGRKKEEKKRTQDDLLDYENQIRNLKSELDILYEKHLQACEQETFLKYLNSIIEMLNEYIELLRESKIAELQRKTYEMYSRLASKGDLISCVEIDPKTFVITIKDTYNNEVLKSNLSAGEKEVFAISLLWGLAQTSRINLPVVIDTPLSRLDSIHRDNIVSNYFSQAGHQVVILSTDTEVDQSYYNKLEHHLQHAIHLIFDKSQEFAQIEEGYFWEQ